jgi:hypothetical protein
MIKTCVIYLVSGAERQSPWFTDEARVNRALAILRARYGNAVLYRD